MGDRGYDRLGEFTLERVFKHTSLNPEDKPKSIRFKGQPVFMGSKRYLNFKAHGTACVECGFKGTYFALERHKYQNTGKYHFNLYGKDSKGVEIMLTKDHIVPKAKGGTDDLSNFQVMCAPCNSKKGDNYLTKDQLIHQARFDIINKAIRIFQRGIKALNKDYQKLREDCIHNIESSSKARCSICDKYFGWYCSASPDKICHYSTISLKGKYMVLLLNNTSHKMEGYSKSKQKKEKLDKCLFCGQPEDRSK